MNNYIIPSLNLATVILVLLFNFLTSNGYINGTTVEEVSSKYYSLLTPAGYAFSIWGVIYLGQIALVAFQWVQLLNKSSIQVKTGVWLVVLNLGNILWLIFWLHEWIGLSVLAMVVILIALLRLVWRFDMECYDAPLRVLVFIWWPVCLYLGWIMLAFGANLSIYLSTLNLIWLENYELHLAMLKIALLAAGYLALIYFRNLREAALVGVWGFLALAYKNWQNSPLIAYVALGISIVLILAAAAHGYKNRYYSPINKWKRGEW